MPKRLTFGLCLYVLHKCNVHVLCCIELVKSPEVTLCGWRGYKPSINNIAGCCVRRHLTEKIEKRQRELDRLEDQIQAAEAQAPAQGSGSGQWAKGRRERERGRRLSMEDLSPSPSPSPSPARHRYEDDSEEEDLLEGKQLLLTVS